jgi:hypothetical protein
LPDNDETSSPVVLHLASPNGPRKPTTGKAQHTGTQSRTINHTLHKDDLQQLNNKLKHQPPPRRNADQKNLTPRRTADQRTSHHGAPPIKEPNSLETSTAIKSISVNLELMHV